MGDYYDGTKKGEQKLKKAQQPLDDGKRRWWNYKGTQCAQSIGDTVNTIQKAQNGRIQQQVINQSLYGNRRLNSVQAAARARLQASQRQGRGNLITDNVVQPVIDTSVSKIGEEKPRPYFLTSGGNYRQQRKAKRLNKYVDGVFYENKAYELTPNSWRDACIDSAGLIFAFVRGGKVVMEPVSSMELWCDEEEAQYGHPRNLFRTKLVDIDELAASQRSPKDRDAILQSSKADTHARQQTVSHMVSVVEAWHLGSLDPDGKRVGGKHAFVLLGKEPRVLGGDDKGAEPDAWGHEFFPFAMVQWSPPPTGCGFWGQSLAEQLQADQIEMNKELQLVQQAMHLSRPKIMASVGSKLVDEHLNNEMWTVLKYAGEKQPQFFVPDPIHPAYFENPQRIRERMFQRAGYSEMAVSAEKPPGLNSGKAIREFVDETSDRHRHSQKLFDAFHVQLAEIVVALSIEAAAQGKLEAVRAPGRMDFDRVDFSEDLKGLKRSEFTLHCYTVSRFPKEPAAKLETVTEYVQAGIWSLRRGKKLLDFPDLEAEETLDTAQEAIITKTLDAIVDDGEYAPPEPTDDLALAKEMALQYIQHYRATDLEEERLNMLRDWNMQVDALMEEALAPAMMGAPAPGPGGEPQAVPEAPPTSPMLPNAPGAGAEGMQAAA